jgi:hypothetical protein
MAGKKPASKKTNNKKADSEEKVAAPSPSRARGKQNKSHSEDAEDEASPKSKSRVKRVVVRSSGRARKEQEPSPRNRSVANKKNPSEDSAAKNDHRRSQRLVESENTRKPPRGKMPTIAAVGKTRRSKYADRDSSSEDSASSSSSASSESDDDTGGDSVSGNDNDSTSESSSGSSSDTLIDKPKKKISLHYVKKLGKQFHSLDDKMKKADYKSVERHIVFSSLSKKLKKKIRKERNEVKKKPSRERRSWEYMYNCWLSYAANNPDRKNQVPIAQTKLSSWVHEQRKKFQRAILSEDRFVLLSRAGFDFQPRKTSAQAMQALLSAVGKLLLFTNATKNKINMCTFLTLNFIILT